MRYRLQVLSLLLAALVVAGCASHPRLPPSAPSPLLGEPLPVVRRPALGGERIAADAVRGHSVVVKFFASYCEPCKRTLPAVERLHEQRPDVLFIGISEDERAAQARVLVKHYGLTFPVVHDRSHMLAGRYRVQMLPMAFVADGDGVVRYVLGPEHSERTLERVLDSLQ